MPAARPRRVAIAVRSWASEESVFVWTWAQKYFIRTGRERDWLYIVHVNTSKDKARDSWKAPGPTIPDLDRALQGYSYDLVELSGETAAQRLVRWVDESSIDVIIISAGRSRRLPNPMQSRTTDYIAANAACSTLVIHPKMSLADLTRVHRMTTPDTESSGAIGAERRVAYAEESQEGLNIMMNWASCNISRPDDSEFQVLVNRNSMLARVSKYVAPATRRRPNPHSGASSSQHGHSNSQGQSVFDTALTPNHSDSAPLPGTSGTEDDVGAPAVLEGKPSQVIQRFVREHNIDLLVIPVTPQATLRRMDKEHKRDLKPSKTFVYHKAECTCLCVPAHLLKLQNGGPTATSSGLLLSEDEVEDDAYSPVPLSASGRLPGRSVSPSRLSSELHMRHMEPIIRPDAHLTPPNKQGTTQPGEEASDDLPRCRHGSLSPPHSSDDEPRPRRSSAPASRNLSTVTSSATTATSAAAAVFNTTSTPTASSPAAAAGESTVYAVPAAHTSRSMQIGEEGSPRPNGNGGHSQTTGSTSTTASGGFSNVGGSGAERGGGERGSGGLFSSLRSRVGKLNMSHSQRERKERAEKEREESLTMSQPTPTSTGPQASPDPGLSTLDAQLSDLQCVLQEGGLSGEVRERGAEAVARARSALCTLAAEAVGLRAKLEEHDERRAMAIAALSGTTPTSAACSVLGGAGSGGLQSTIGNFGSGLVPHPFTMTPSGPLRSTSNLSNASGPGTTAAAAAVAAMADANGGLAGSERVSDPQIAGSFRGVSTGGDAAGNISAAGERLSDSAGVPGMLLQAQLVPGASPPRTGTPTSVLFGGEEELSSL